MFPQGHATLVTTVEDAWPFGGTLSRLLPTATENEHPIYVSRFPTSGAESRSRALTLCVNISKVASLYSCSTLSTLGQSAPSSSVNSEMSNASTSPSEDSNCHPDSAGSPVRESIRPKNSDVVFPSVATRCSKSRGRPVSSINFLGHTQLSPPMLRCYRRPRP